MGCDRPRDCSIRLCTPRSRDAATIFIAFVIFAMLLRGGRGGRRERRMHGRSSPAEAATRPTLFIRCFTICRDTPRLPSGASVSAASGARSRAAEAVGAPWGRPKGPPRRSSWPAARFIAAALRRAAWLS